MLNAEGKVEIYLSRAENKEIHKHERKITGEIKE